MSLMSVALVAGGVVFGGAGWVLMRGDRLTFGQGAQCALGGLALVVSGLWRGVWARPLAAAGVPCPECVMLLVLLAAAMGAWLRQAVLAARVQKRLRALAADHALTGAAAPSEGR